MKTKTRFYDALLGEHLTKHRQMALVSGPRQVGKTTTCQNLKYYQDQVNAPFAFQVVIEADFVDADCFAKPRGPVVVPAKTFLSQLL